MKSDDNAQVFSALYRSAMSLFAGAGVSASVYHALRWFGVESFAAGLFTICGMMAACATYSGHLLGTAADSFHPKLDTAITSIEDIERNTRH